MNRRNAFLGAAGVAMAFGLGALSYRAHTGLQLSLRTGIAHAMGISVDAVVIDRARLGLAGLQIDGLAAGEITVAHARFVPRLSSLLGGRMDGTLHVDAVVIEDPPLGAFDHVTIERADVVLDAEVRVHAHGVSAELGPWARRLPVTVGDFGIELERKGGKMRRAAFTALSVGPLHDLSGGLHGRDGVVSLTAAATGVVLSAKLLPDGLYASATLDHFGLSFDARTLPWGATLGVPAARLALTGTASVGVPRGSGEGPAHVELAFEATGSVDAPRLSARAIDVGGTSLDARGTLDDGTAHMTVHAARAGAAVDAKFDVADSDDVGAVASTTLHLPELPCATLFAAMPETLRPALDGMGLDGTVAGDLTLNVPVDAPSQLTLDGALGNHCIVTSEPALADVDRIRQEAPRLPGARDAAGQPRVVELGRGNPGYRALDVLPNVLTSIFLQSEDGRFWKHPGIDLAEIGHALSRDIETGTPGRGGSTITQQVAKNLFLSGERTLGRKLEEAVLAWRLEERLGKRRILELYLNLVELGPGIYGVAEGAQAYFHKDVADLDASEAAKLAALLPAPRRGMDEAWARRHAQLVARLPASLRPDLTATRVSASSQP